MKWIKILQCSLYVERKKRKRKSILVAKCWPGCELCSCLIIPGYFLLRPKGLRLPFCQVAWHVFYRNFIPLTFCTFYGCMTDQSQQDIFLARRYSDGKSFTCCFLPVIVNFLFTHTQRRNHYKRHVKKLSIFCSRDHKWINESIGRKLYSNRFSDVISTSGIGWVLSRF